MLCSTGSCTKKFSHNYCKTNIPQNQIYLSKTLSVQPSVILKSYPELNISENMTSVNGIYDLFWNQGEDMDRICHISQVEILLTFSSIMVLELNHLSQKLSAEN